MAETIGLNQKAVFHDGALQTVRMAKLQEEINTVRVNPLAFNLEKNTYNYEIWFANLNSLYSEGVPKFSEEERKELQDVRKLIELHFKHFPIYITTINQANNTTNKRLQVANWDKLNKLLTIYEKYVRCTLDIHGLTNPDNESDGLF